MSQDVIEASALPMASIRASRLLGCAFRRILFILLKAEARTREALVDAMGPAISSITKEDAWGFFEHCGYSTPVQPL